VGNKRWRATFISHFGTDIEADTQREAEAKALAWLQEEYGYDLAKATEFEVEATDE